MTESKIITNREKIDKFDNTYSNFCGDGNGYCYSNGDSDGDSLSDGYSDYDGESSGTSDPYDYIGGKDYDKLSDLLDPITICPLRFYSQMDKKIVNWDDVWDECNVEQKQHLLLFLPLRVSND